MQPTEWLKQLKYAVANQNSEAIKQAIYGFRNSLPTSLDIDHLARWLKVDPRTARKWEKQGTAPRSPVPCRAKAINLVYLHHSDRWLTLAVLH